MSGVLREVGLLVFSVLLLSSLIIGLIAIHETNILEKRMCRELVSGYPGLYTVLSKDCPGSCGRRPFHKVVADVASTYNLSPGKAEEVAVCGLYLTGAVPLPPDSVWLHAVSSNRYEKAYRVLIIVTLAVGLVGMLLPVFLRARK